MATVVKDILYEGTVHPENREPYTFEPGSADHFRQRLADMIADGLHIPITWDHQEEFEERPLTRQEVADRKARLAQLALGHISAAAGVEDGALRAALDVPNDPDLDKLRAIKFVSPFIRWNVTDANGKRWPGPSIISLAATPRPIQTRQQPFRLGQTPPGGFLRLSQDSYAKGSAMADDVKPDEAPEEKPETTPAASEGNDGGLGELLSLLESHGISLPGDTTKKNLIERLRVALTVLGAAKEDDDVSDPNSTNPTEGVTSETPTPVAMGASLEDRESRVAAMERLWTDRERRTLSERCERLHGLLSRPEVDALKQRAAQEPIRLGADGTAEKTPLLIELEAYERALAKMGTPFRPVKLGQDSPTVPTPVPPPSGSPAAGPKSTEDVLDQWDVMMGRKAR